MLNWINYHKLFCTLLWIVVSRVKIDVRIFHHISLQSTCKWVKPTYMQNVKNEEIWEGIWPIWQFMCSFSTVFILVYNVIYKRPFFYFSRCLPNKSLLHINIIISSILSEKKKKNRIADMEECKSVQQTNKYIRFQKGQNSDLANVDIYYRYSIFMNQFCCIIAGYNKMYAYNLRTIILLFSLSCFAWVGPKVIKTQIQAMGKWACNWVKRKLKGIKEAKLVNCSR